MKEKWLEIRIWTLWMKDQYTLLPDLSDMLTRKPFSFDVTKFFDLHFKISISISLIFFVFSIVPTDKKDHIWKPIKYY